jgi:FixJ family two-component response regulator
MLCGTLKNLRAMMDARRGKAAAVTPERLKDRLARLSESEREVVRRIVEELGK